MEEISLCHNKRSLCPDGFLHQMLTASGHAAFSSVGGANHLDFLWHCILHLAKRGLGSGVPVDHMKRYHRNPMPQTPVCCEGTVMGRECWMPGEVWAPWSSVRMVWPCPGWDMLTNWVLSLQSGKATAEKSNHLLRLYLALECFVWRQSNENHPKEVLCWWENYERPKKGRYKKICCPSWTLELPNHMAIIETRELER